MAIAGRPVVFVPGLWMHAESWRSWVELFRDAGYVPIAESWPGIPGTILDARANPEGAAGRGIGEITDHYERIMRSLASRPIVIGHSFGGLVAQKLLGRGLASAAIAIDAAPIKGVLPLPISTLRSALPILRNPANRRRAVPLSPEAFRYGFANAVSPEEAADLYRRWAIPGPGRPLFQAAFANLAPRSEAAVDTRNASRGPLLLIAGEEDHLVPPVVTRATLRLYRKSPAVTEFHLMPGRGHSLTIDHGWREVAHVALSWLASHGLGSPLPSVGAS